jgi:hypothetical protein
MHLALNGQKKPTLSMRPSNVHSHLISFDELCLGTQLFWSEHNRAPLTQDFEQLSKIKALLHNQYGFPYVTI